MNENMVKWITSSINKYFMDNDEDYKLWLEGESITDILAKQDHAEIRIDMDVLFVAKDSHHIPIYINILCVSSINSQDIYKIQRMVGKYLSLFITSIPIYQYGDLPTTLVGCAQLQDQVIITNFAEKDNMQRTSLEGEYRLVL